MRWVGGVLCGTLAVAGCGRLGFGADGDGTSDAPMGDATIVTDASCAGGCAATTYQWTAATPAVTPGPRDRHGMVFDRTSDRVLLFGGFDGFDVQATTWAWDGSTWTDVTPVLSPPARQDPAMTYDDARGEVVMFGGLGVGGPLADTWRWDGVAWSEVMPATSPLARYSPTLAYDAARGEAILYGGSSGAFATAAYAETWAWNGTTWTLRASAAESPPPRDQHALVYDPDRRDVVTYGGVDSAGIPRDDTWAWDGVTWRDRSPATGPGDRNSYALVAAGLHRRVLLFGGPAPGGYSATTWAWDGATWTDVVPTGAPPGREQTAMAFDEARGAVVMYGGHTGPFAADTWLLTP